MEESLSLRSTYDMAPFKEAPVVSASSSEEEMDNQDEYAEAEATLEGLDGEEKREMLEWMGEKAYCISNECVAEDRYRWLEKAYTHLKTVYDEDETDPDCLRCLAAVTGRLAEESGMRKKISLGFEFKKYLDQAIEADRKDDADNTFELYHMRGRFAYTVLSMSISERVLARVIGAVPEFTIEGAVADLKKAAELRELAENELFLAKALILRGDKTEAKERLQKAVQGDPDSAIEEEYTREAQELLNMI